MYRDERTNTAQRGIRIRIPDRSVERLRVQMCAGCVFTNQCVAAGEQVKFGEPPSPHWRVRRRNAVRGRSALNENACCDGSQQAL
jgi:hypothetical protein